MTSKEKKNKRAKRRSYSWLSTLLLIFLVAAGVGVGVLVYAAQNLPAWDPQQLSGASTTFLYDDQGKVLAGLHAEQNRTETSLNNVPPDLINAFIATEDQDFYRHHGVNFKGIVRALLVNLQSGDLTGQGASTITQQLARNAFLTFDKQWERKIKEVLLAFKLETHYSKDEILSMYLNKIYFGAGAYGVQAAANTYFGKDVSKLDLAESSLLAGLPQSPNSYNPFQYYDRAKARQQMVLKCMVDCNYIDQETAQQAFETPLVFKKSFNSGSRYGYFIDAVIDETLDILEAREIYEDPNNAIYRSGLKIYTTMNAQLESHAEEFFKNPANFPSEQKNGEQIQCAMALIDHSNGEVKAIMGGRSYEQRRGFNRATNALRQPGSSIKPLTVYAPALEDGYMPFFTLIDEPISIKVGNTIWSPKNYDPNYRGLISMRTAVQWSVNTYAVQLLEKVGVRKSFDFGKSLGLDLVDTPGTNDLSLAPLSLGGLTRGASPVQMAAAYGAFGNGGLYAKPHFVTRILDADGVEIYRFKPDYHRAMSEETAWLMNSMLQTVVSSGTGTNARVPGVQTGGKTGTSEEYKDSWFCGVTPGYSAAIWMGYDREHTMNKVYGGSYPARMFRSMMQKAHEIKNPKPRSMPAGIVSVSVCSKSGKLPAELCSQEQIFSDYCLKNKVPTEICDAHNMVSICPESGKLAGRYCPNPEMRSLTKDETPTEKCDIHSDFSLPALLNNEIYVCRDPRHNGKIYRANLPNPLQSGGCPPEYLEKVIVENGDSLPYCSLEDHQLKKKKAREVFDDVIGL
ncbi:transglycosylase domain-containing protein [Syntrophomonas wolfei]|uniref:Penicillin-binding protein 1A n=1 Tax=Syntrophomonas wolfei subsp. wolfei (strain DSM 2245B / Goettingen) TaxID=335541 RepID=Q0AXY5_SYNWW|nr:penicillin-binding protein 1A [Syntrophomonas wolfei]ABI68419.1 Peptidoglycan glycosyltransferase [Syntrophomonas wolfei subsp. wolfei str. Goettingen G311]